MTVTGVPGAPVSGDALNPAVNLIRLVETPTSDPAMVSCGVVSAIFIQ